MTVLGVEHPNLGLENTGFGGSQYFSIHRPGFANKDSDRVELFVGLDATGGFNFNVDRDRDLVTGLNAGFGRANCILVFCIDESDMLMLGLAER